jgi:microsomal dipeptidase-like Zn-dependent dipeptidase
MRKIQGRGQITGNTVLELTTSQPRTHIEASMEAFGLLIFWTLFSTLECFATIKVRMLGLAHNWALGDSVSII